MFGWLKRWKRRQASASSTAGLSPSPVPQVLGGYQVSERNASSVRPRTAQFRREGIAAVFEAWSAAYEKKRLHPDFNPPVSRDVAEHAESCTQIFLDLAAELWPADEAIRALRDARSVKENPWLPVSDDKVTQLRRNTHGR